MCIGIAQYKLDYGKSFRESDLEELQLFEELSRKAKDLMPKSLRINLWKEAVIIKGGEKPDSTRAQFAWLEEKKTGGTWPVFNVRVEGGWNNKANERDYSGPYQIFNNPYVADLLPNQRCVIPCDFFIEQNSDKKDKRKFLIQKQNQRPIHLAGVYKELCDESTGEIKSFFAILTTAHNPITFQVGHQRSPVILENSQLMQYLNPETKREDLIPMFKPIKADDLEAYEVDPVIAKVNCPLAEDDLKLREAIGEIIRV